ncbi:MAG: PA4780 family RIO1-like protein kinase [Gammaproteobacteria bacterium]|nr:PA4780 family RIO1-like protein kinase [Gammaproteobacteria bacterium]
MKIPQELQTLIEDGVIDEVLRTLKSGKEASVYTVRAGGQVLCAKVYKDMARRSFQARSRYQEGRKVRGSRQARAVGRASRFGRRQQEEDWKNTEADALYQLAAAGVQVPEPRGFFQGVLLMALVTDGVDSHEPAPRLVDVDLSAEEAIAAHDSLIRDVVRMLCLGLIHGDLSEYNVLMAADGPVIIDFPQVVSASGNNAARDMLLRDVHNLRGSLGRFAPALAGTHYGEEMWALFEQGELQPDTPLTGHFEFDEQEADLDAVRSAIDEARREQEIRELGRQDAERGED